MAYPDDFAQELEKLIAQHGDYIFRLCCTILSDRSIAEDAWQDTWIKVWKGINSFHGNSAAKTWITRIAINTCRDIRRSSWFRLEWRTGNPEALSSLPAPDPPADLGVMDAISTLPMRYREAITLYYMEEMSIKELADALGISPNTAASRIRRGREKLKKVLKGGMNRE